MAVRRFVAKNGLDNNGNSLLNIANPVGNQDIATKSYVQTVVGTAKPAFAAYCDMYPGTPEPFVDTTKVFKDGNFAHTASTLFNIGNCWDLSTGLFTAPVTGVYLFSGFFTGQFGHRYLEIYRAGVATNARELCYTETWDTVTATVNIPMNAGEQTYI